MYCNKPLRCCTARKKIETIIDHKTKNVIFLAQDAKLSSFYSSRFTAFCECCQYFGETDNIYCNTISHINFDWLVFNVHYNFLKIGSASYLLADKLRNLNLTFWFESQDWLLLSNIMLKYHLTCQHAGHAMFFMRKWSIQIQPTRGRGALRK